MSIRIGYGYRYPYRPDYIVSITNFTIFLSLQNGIARLFSVTDFHVHQYPPSIHLQVTIRINSITIQFFLHSLTIENLTILPTGRLVQRYHDSEMGSINLDPESE